MFFSLKNYLIFSKRKLWKLKKLIESVFIFSFSNFLNGKAYLNSKSVFLNLEDGYLYNRYYYILAKFFLIEGFTVYLPKSLKLIYSLNTDFDSSFILKEKSVLFGKTKNQIFELNDKNVSSDYFNFLSNPDSILKKYFIPLGQHSYLYFKGYWNQEFDRNIKRKNSLFLAGNFKKHTYNNSGIENVFNVNNRISLYKKLSKHQDFVSFKSFEALDNFISSDSDLKILIIDRKNDLNIPPAKIRQIVSKFNFFLALPGVFMPLCHNIIEAMSVGTIPFLQEGYANIMRPPLISGETCITFKNMEEINEKIVFLFSLPKTEIERIRENVFAYYDKYLSPSAIVHELKSGNYEKIYLMAESHSVKLLSESLKENHNLA